MIDVRAAHPDDAPELARLRLLMFQAMSGMAEHARPGPWQEATEAVVRRRLAAADGTLAVFVSDDPDRPGRLACCAIGTLELRLPSPVNLGGLFGFIFNVCTDPGQRGRGHARACVEALLAWFDKRGAARVDLHATPDAEPLYRSLGFADHSVPLSRTRPAGG